MCECNCEVVRDTRLKMANHRGVEVGNNLKIGNVPLNCLESNRPNKRAQSFNVFHGGIFPGLIHRRGGAHWDAGRNTMMCQADGQSWFYPCSEKYQNLPSNMSVMLVDSSNTANGPVGSGRRHKKRGGYKILSFNKITPETEKYAAAATKLDNENRANMIGGASSSPNFLMKNKRYQDILRIKMFKGPWQTQILSDLNSEMPYKEFDEKYKIPNYGAYKNLLTI